MKFPFLKFFPGDWLKEPSLTICSPAARGVWIDLICVMHESGRVSELRGTAEQLARLARCSPADLSCALTELQTTKAAEILDRNGIITVSCRRLKREEKDRNGAYIRQIRHRSGGGVTGLSRSSNGDISEVRYQKSEREGEFFSPPQEIPTEQEALDQTATAGIPADFARYVFQDWSSRQGKDAAGNVVAWPHYVTKRWAREQVEWKAGTHRGKKAAPSAARVGPTLAEVRALLVEKHGKTPEVENWAVSFYGHWNDPKRNWSRKSHPIDWKVELSQQVAKWKTAKQVNP